MPIRVACKCGQAFAAPDNFAGQVVKCPNCREPLKIPKPQVAAPAPAAAPSGLTDLLDEVGVTAHAGPRCPACDAPMSPQAVLCTKCGFNRQTGTRAASEVRNTKHVGHGEAAASLMARAAAEVAAAPVHKDDKDMGGVRSIWTWVFVLFVPVMFAIGFAVAVIWGSSLLVPLGVIWGAIMSGHLTLIIPGLLLLGGILLLALGWLAVTSTALERNVWHGLACMLTLGLYGYFWGLANWRFARSQMQTYLTGVCTFNFGCMALLMSVAFESSNYLVILPLLFLAVGQTIAFVGMVLVTLQAFEEKFSHGMLSMFVPLYAPIYGFMRWANCKREMILFLSGFGTSMLGSVLFVVLSMTQVIKSPDYRKFYEDAARKTTGQVLPSDGRPDAPSRSTSVVRAA